MGNTITPAFLALPFIPTLALGICRRSATSAAATAKPLAPAMPVASSLVPAGGNRQ